MRDCTSALSSPAKSIMQLFMWQHDIVGVAHLQQVNIFMSLVPCLMLLMMHQPALAAG